MAPSLVALNQKAVNIVLFYFSGNNVWKNEKQEPKKADKKKKFLLTRSSPRYCLKRTDGLLAEDLARGPEAAHRGIASSSLILPAPREAGLVCPCKWAELRKWCLNLLPMSSLLVTSSGVLYFGWPFYITCFAQHFVGVSVEKSQSAQENDLLSIPFVSKGMKCWTSLRRPCCHEVSSPHSREGFNIAWGTTT